MDKQRREEIQAKRAKLAELKRQRELRAKDAGKGGMGSPSDVCCRCGCASWNDVVGC